MKIGDLVRYHASETRSTSLLRTDEQLGIITKVGKWNKSNPECHVVWYTCNNEGWWNSENLEVVSESR